MLTRGSLKGKDAPDADALAIMAAAAAADLHHMSLRRLVRHRHWSTLIERVRAHPEVIRKTTPCEKGGYYTILHTVMFHRRYNQNYDFFAPVVKAILAAADKIDYTPEGQQQQEDHLLSGISGSWRLLLDNNNHDGVSPLHALCDNNSFCNIPMLKVLLQMDKNDDIADADYYQHRIITLQDSQYRNIIHRFLEEFPPFHVCEVIRFAVALSPAVLCQRDIRGRTPLDTAVSKFSPQQWRFRSPEPSITMRKWYGILKLLVQCLELHSRTSGSLREIWAAVDEDEEGYPNINNTEGQNVLHLACRLQYRDCPPDGILIERLLHPNVLQLEAYDRGTMWRETIDMAAEVDVNGNLPFHLFLSNNTWPSSRLTSSEISTEMHMIHLLSSGPLIYANFHPNRDGKLPVKLAMQAGRKLSTWYLTLANAAAVFFDETMRDVKLFAHLLCLMTSSSTEFNIHTLDRRYFLNATFILLRGRPELFSHAFP